MIPRRLCLRGFMGYREEMVLCFRGAHLWALTGENAVGKTTVFDAIFFALYGEHRLDAKEKAQQLIHTASPLLVVEFDFAVGEEEYRIRRTMSRDSTTRIRQAWHLKGSDLIPEPIAETHRESGLKAWVKQVVGLDSRVFTFSIWLQQGKSDALLTATVEERQRLISQIIDLSVYERLYRRAEEGYKRWEAQARSEEVRLLQLKPIEEQRLEALKVGEQQAQLGKQVAKERHIRLAELRIHAQRWQECERERKKYLQALSSTEALLAHAPQIEQDMQRVCLLNEVLPLIEELLQRQNTTAQLIKSLQALQQKQQQQVSVLEQEKATYRGLQEELEQCRKSRKQQQEEGKNIEHRLLALEPGIRDVDLLEAMRNQVGGLQEQVKKIDPALDQKYQQVQQELEELEVLRTVLPWLRQFATARQQWARWGKELALLVAQQPELEASLLQRRKELEGCLDRLRPLKEREEHHLQETTRAETLLWQCKQHEKKFREIDGKATCSYCGQALTPEHLEMERQKVYEELRQRRASLQEEQQHLKQLQKQYEKEQVLLQNVQRVVQEKEQALKTLQERRMLLTSQRREAETQAEAALQEIPELFLRRIQDGETKPLSLLSRLQTVFPSDEELMMQQQRVAREKMLSTQIRRLQSRREEKQRLVTQCEYICQQILQKEKTFSVEQQRSLKETYRQVQQERKMLAEQMVQTNQRIEQQEHRLQEQGGCVQKSEQALQKVVEQIIVAQRDSEHTQELIREKEEALPVDWRHPAVQLSREKLEAWKKEKEALGNAASRLEGLRAAQRDVQSYRQRLAEQDAEREKTPVEAQRSVKDLDREIVRVVQNYEQYEQEQQRFQREKTSAEEICRQHQLCQQQFQEARHKAVLYKELRRLLSAEYLQHFLIQKAEQGIVSATNEFLDRLSGGTLRLGLRGEGGQTRMLDLVAYHLAISTTVPQDLKLLSGGQKFQIAVSLALGIGKYAGEGTQRIETVLIDEGFGGLDVKRRQAMVQGLQDLQAMLKCIIVVSHQADLYEQFENRYYVWLEDNCSKVSLRDEGMDAEEKEALG